MKDEYKLLFIVFMYLATITLISATFIIWP